MKQLVSIFLSIVMMLSAAWADDTDDRVVCIEDFQLPKIDFMETMKELNLGMCWSTSEMTTNFEESYSQQVGRARLPVDIRNKKLDYKTCKCLKSSSYEDVTETMNSGVFYHQAKNSNSKDAIANLNHNLYGLKDKFEDQLNAIAVQASLVGDADMVKDLRNDLPRKLFQDIKETVINVKESKSKGTQPKRARGSSDSSRSLELQHQEAQHQEALAQRLEENSAIPVGTDAMTGAVIGAAAGKVAIEEAKKNVGSSFDTLVNFLENNVPNTDSRAYSDSELGGNQCVGMREFMALKQLPSDKSIYAELSTTSLENFNEKNWDIEFLKTEFKKLTSLKADERLANKDKIVNLRAKIRFLNRNPLIQNFFRATKDNKSFYDGAKKSSSEREETEKVYAAVDLAAKKKELFGILKGVIPNTNACKKGHRSCLKDFNNRDVSAKFQESIAKFFVDDKDVKVISKTENEKRAYSVLNSFINDESSYLPSPSDTKMSYSQIQDQYRSLTGDTSDVTECRQSGRNLENCIKKYAAYCSLLEPVWEQQRNNWFDSQVNDPLLVDDIDDLIKKDLDLTPESNEEFKQFNYDVCEAGYEKGNILLGKDTKSFNSWRREYCTQRTATNCGRDVASYKRLREQFFKEYDDPLNDDDRTRFMVNILNGSKEVKSLTPSEVRTVESGSSTSVAEIVRRPQRNNTSSVVESTNVKLDTPVLSTPSGLSEAVTEDLGPSMMNDKSATTMPVMNPLYSQLPAEGEKLTEADKENIRSLAEDEIARDRKELAAAKNPEEKEALEERLKLLEELLSQKSDNEKKYQDLLSQLNQRLADVESGKAQESFNSQQENSNQRRAPASTTGQYSSPVTSDDQERARIQVPTLDQRVNSAGTAGQSSTSQASSFSSPSSGRARSSSGSGANSALLDAAIARGKASSDGAAIIIQEVDRGTATAIENTANVSQQIALNVPANVYAQFQSENVEVLRRYKDQILRNVEEDQPVRLVVKNGQQSLNVVIMKRNGNLVFMPPRVFSLKSLNQQLQSTTRSPSGM